MAGIETGAFARFNTDGGAIRLGGKSQYQLNPKAPDGVEDQVLPQKPFLYGPELGRHGDVGHVERKRSLLELLLENWKQMGPEGLSPVLE